MIYRNVNVAKMAYVHIVQCCALGNLCTVELIVHRHPFHVYREMPMPKWPIWRLAFLCTVTIVFIVLFHSPRG